MSKKFSLTTLLILTFLYSCSKNISPVDAAIEDGLEAHDEINNIIIKINLALNIH